MPSVLTFESRVCQFRRISLFESLDVVQLLTKVSVQKCLPLSSHKEKISSEEKLRLTTLLKNCIFR